MNEKVLRQIIRESLVGLTESVKEKAVSKSQQRFFGMVDAYKKGELDDASKAVKDAAEGMSMKQVKDFAKTKHKGLPNHVDESVLRSIIRETLEQTWADREPKDEMDNIRLQRYQGLVEIVEYYLNQCEAGNGVELSDKQREQLEDACNKLCVFGEIGEKWANLGRSILSGNEDVTEEKPFTDENVYTMDDWRRDGSLKVQIGQLIAPEVYWQLRDSVPPMSDGGCFQPGEAYDHDWRTGKALYQTFTREGDNYYRYKGLQPASRWGLEESELKKTIRETVQTHLVNVLGKYTQGKVSSKEANKAIMDLANSSNQKKLNEEVDARTLEYFNKIRNGECETLEWEGRIFRVPPQLKQIARQVSEQFNVVASPYVYQNDSRIYCALLVDAPEDCDYYTVSKNVKLFLLDYDLHYIGCYHRTIFFVRQILEKHY